MPPLVLVVGYDASDSGWTVRIKGYPPYMVFKFARIETLVALMDAAKDASPVHYELAAPTLVGRPQALQELAESGISRGMGPPQ